MSSGAKRAFFDHLRINGFALLLRDRERNDPDGAVLLGQPFAELHGFPAVGAETGGLFGRGVDLAAAVGAGENVGLEGLLCRFFTSVFGHRRERSAVGAFHLLRGYVKTLFGTALGTFDHDTCLSGSVSGADLQDRRAVIKEPHHIIKRITN
jgi:hypothetical protein